jgi:hypothetical protein
MRMKKEQDWLILAFAIAVAVLVVIVLILALFMEPRSQSNRQHAIYDTPPIMVSG